jgi:hypothetical protein
MFLVAAVGREYGRRESFCPGDNRSTGYLAVGSLEVDLVRARFNVCEIWRSRCDQDGRGRREYLALQEAERCLARLRSFL